MIDFREETLRLVRVISAQEYGKTMKGDGAVRMFLKQLCCGPVPVTDATKMGANLLGKARTYMFHHDLPLTVLRDGDTYYLAIRQIKEEK